MGFFNLKIYYIMEHSISKNTDFGRAELSVTETKDLKSAFISVSWFNNENELIDVQHIELNSKEFYNFIGTMLFVQSKIKKNEK